MIRILSILMITGASIHGLIHLLGFLAYWPLMKFAQLPYKTSLLGGRLELGPEGMRVYSVLWLLAALGFIGAAILLAIHQKAWAPIMLAASLLSLILCVLDREAAAAGILVNAAFLLALFVVFGFRVAPAPFARYKAIPQPVTTTPIPTGLPKPVEQFYHLTYGSQVPVYTSAVISGRGTIRFMGVTMPARLRFTHIPSVGYHHYMETTFYGFPILKVNEHYLNGNTRFELPFGVQENEPTLNSAANQGLWAEMIAYPAVYLTDPRARWEAVDDQTAKLHIPFGEDTQELTFRFDPQSGDLIRVETLRFRDATSGQILWWGDLTSFTDVEGEHPIQRWAIVWSDEGTPWLSADIETILFNADVDDYIRQPGP